MSNEEALQILSERDRIGVNIINANDAETTKYNNDSIEALSMAIEALKAEPCEDAVSRQAALKEMERYHDDCDKTSVYTRLGFETAMEVVKSLSPVTLKPRTDVLDKIRAEIEQEYNRLKAARADETLELGTCLGLKMSLKIINKYKEGGT